MRAQLEDVSYSHAETDAQLSTREVRIFAVERGLVGGGFVLGWVGYRECMRSLSRGWSTNFRRAFPTLSNPQTLLTNLSILQHSMFF